MGILDNLRRDELVSRIIDSPETLTKADFDAIETDEELSELYEAAVLCKEASAFDAPVIPDVEEELARFKAMRSKKSRVLRLRPFMRIAVAFVGFMTLTISVMAVVSPKFARYFYFAADSQDEHVENFSSDLPVASPITTIEGIVIKNDVELKYDNSTLEKITEHLAGIYKVDVAFENEEAKNLRLYLVIEPGKTIDDVVEMLNNFGRFQVSLCNGSLVIK